MYIKVMHKIYLIAKRFFLRVKILREKNSVSPLDSSLNFSSNSGEKSYFAIWLDFDQKCSVLQKGKVFQKYSPVLLSNVLTDRINPTLASICFQ